VTRLDLTREQVDKLQPVFDETARELRTIHSRAIRDSDEVICKAHQRIAAELTPEQKKKLEDFEQERREWLRKNGPSAKESGGESNKKLDL
jgi:Spy/CpxP family protein refolding chaperone